jgi:hypothetical protein
MINILNAAHGVWKAVCDLSPSKGTTNPELMQWLLYGERGSSSEAMVAHITGTGKKVNHPYDPSDLRRCRLLVEQVPSIRISLSKMASCSAVWSRIIEHWNELCELMDQEAPNWRQCKGSSPKTYELMRKLIADA